MNDLKHDLKEGGREHALRLALRTVIAAHPHPKDAARYALNAIEAELVERLNKPPPSNVPPALFEEWLAGLQDIHDTLRQSLENEFFSL